MCNVAFNKTKWLKKNIAYKGTCELLTLLMASISSNYCFYNKIINLLLADFCPKLSKLLFIHLKKGLPTQK